jgi:molybdopterin molybdotransferase
MQDLTPSLEEALHLVLCGVRPVRAVGVGQAEAAGRVLRQALISDIDYPTADVSAVDGFCLRADDTAGAMQTHPVVLPVEATIRAGQSRGSGLSPGHCARIMTGAAVPPGGDAVVRSEDVAEADERILVARPVRAGDGVRRAGEVARKGDCLLNGGEMLTPARIGLLASFGACTVQVNQRPRVALLGVGDELVDCSRRPANGEVRRSNTATMMALLDALRCDIIDLGTVGDDEGQIVARLDRSGECEMVITAGGVSGGLYDLVPRALERMGARTLFKGIRMLPGKATVAAELNRLTYVCLPGNPVAGFVVFWVLVRRLLLAMMGYAGSDVTTVRAFVVSDIAGVPGFKTFVPARLLQDSRVEPTLSSACRDVAGLAASDCLIVIDGTRPAISGGQPVEVMLLR